MLEQIPNSNIFTIDALYQEQGVAAIYLIRSQNRLAIVDTGTTHSVLNIEQSIQQLSLNWSNVDFIILTHIHLDHAGGASTLMQHCTNAKLIVHPKGARHMVEPERLIAGTVAVYGQEYFDDVYGEITPIDAQRIIQPADQEIIQFASRPLQFIDTPGHANHHHCIIDSQTNSVFTGDTFGVSYASLRQGDTGYLLPSTSPVQFDPEALHRSIDRVMAHQPERFYLTHYGVFTPSALTIASLHEQIDDFVMLTQQAVEQYGLSCQNELQQVILKYLSRNCANQFPSVDINAAQEWLCFDAKLNTQGLLVWASQQAAKNKTT